MNLNSVFFTRVKSSIIGGIVFFFILYIVNYIVSSSDGVAFEVKEQASLSSHAAMAFGAETLLLLEVLTFKKIYILDLIS